MSRDNRLQHPALPASLRSVHESDSICIQRASATCVGIAEEVYSLGRSVKYRSIAPAASSLSFHPLASLRAPPSAASSSCCDARPSDEGNRVVSHRYSAQSWYSNQSPTLPSTIQVRMGSNTCYDERLGNHMNESHPCCTHRVCEREHQRNNDGDDDSRMAREPIADDVRLHGRLVSHSQPGTLQMRSRHQYGSSTVSPKKRIHTGEDPPGTTSNPCMTFLATAAALRLRKDTVAVRSDPAGGGVGIPMS